MTECCSPETSINPYLLLILIAAAVFVYLHLKYIVSGTAQAVSGHTIQIGRKRIRLVALCALQPGQPWWDHNGVQHNGGQLCKDALAHLVNGKKVRCRIYRRYGAYGRMYARCYVNCEDVGKWLVRQGYAVAVPRFGPWYVRHEKYARRKKNGIWRGKFDSPTEYGNRESRKRLIEIYRKRKLEGNPDDMTLEDLADALNLAWKWGKLMDPMSYFLELDLEFLSEVLPFDWAATA